MASPKELEIADPKTENIVANVPISCAGWPHLVVPSADGILAFVSVMFKTKYSMVIFPSLISKP